MKTLLTLLLLIPSLSWGLDKNELKEELKYWKSLLDDELISQEDYNQKKEELINISTKSNKSYKKTNNNDFINNIKNIFDSDEKSKDEESPKESNKYLTKYKDFPLYEDSVLNIQKAFVSMGFDISADGIYGSETKGVLDYWMNCNNFTKFNAKKYYDLINGMGCTSENYSDKTNSTLTTETYDVSIARPYTKIYKTPCSFGWGAACKEKDVLLTPENGDELKIVWWQINAYCVDIIKVLHKESNTIGFIHEESMNIKNKSNFFDMSKVSKGEKHYDGRSKCIISTYKADGYNFDTLYSLNSTDNSINSNNTTYETSSNTTKTSVNNSNSNSNTSSSKSKCSGLNSDKSWVYKGLTGYFSKKDACLKIASYSDDKICSKIKKGKDDILNAEESWYQKEISSRGMVCIDGVAFDKSDSSTKTLQAIQKLEDKIDSQPKYKEVCRNEKVLGERLDGSTYTKTIRNCKNVKIKTDEQILNEAVGGAIMSIFD